MKKLVGVLAFIAIVLSSLIFNKQCFAQNDKKASGRIDIYSEDMKFVLKDVKSNGAVQYAAWIEKKQDQKKDWITQMELTNNDWQQLWIEFTPQGPGFIYIVLRGSFYPDNKTNHHQVCVDDVSMEGLKIKNGSFEEQDKAGNPSDWGIPAASTPQYSNLAHSGRYSMIVWHDSPVVQKIPVKAGAKYRIGAWFKSY